MVVLVYLVIKPKETTSSRTIFNLVLLGCLSCENNSDNLTDSVIKENGPDENPDSSLYFPGTNSDY